eukprot:s149_g14.t1
MLGFAACDQIIPIVEPPFEVCNCADETGKARSMKSTSNLESPVQYIQADSLPRLPGGKVRKAPQPPSWLTPL